MNSRPVPMIFLPGWSFAATIFNELLQYFPENFLIKCIDWPEFAKHPAFSQSNNQTLLTEFLETIIQQCDEPVVWCGWSLGGAIAMELAKRYPNKTLGFVTLATNLQFVANEAWPYAVDKNWFTDFRKRFRVNAETTLQQFDLLMTQGSEFYKKEYKFLKQYREKNPQLDNETLIITLDWLEAIRIHVTDNIFNKPNLHFLGEQDELVPVNIVEAFAKISAPVRILSNASHALLFTHAKMIAEEIQLFVAKLYENA